jgi:hypothetical protein
LRWTRSCRPDADGNQIWALIRAIRDPGYHRLRRRQRAVMALADHIVGSTTGGHRCADVASATW